MGLRTIFLSSTFSMLAATSSFAATYTLDASSSSVNVTMSGACAFTTACANVSASLGSGASGVNWTPTSATDTLTVTDFIDWTVTGGLIHAYTVSVSLAFTAPSAATGSGSGGGTAGHGAGVAASASDGSLAWNPSAGIGFADSSVLYATFEGMSGFGLVADGDIITFSSGMTLSLVAPSPVVVPLPAALPLLLAGFGGIAFVGRRRKSI